MDMRRICTREALGLPDRSREGTRGREIMQGSGREGCHAVPREGCHRRPPCPPPRVPRPRGQGVRSHRPHTGAKDRQGRRASRVLLRALRQGWNGSGSSVRWHFRCRRAGRRPMGFRRHACHVRTRRTGRTWSRRQLLRGLNRSNRPRRCVSRPHSRPLAHRRPPSPGRSPPRRATPPDSSPEPSAPRPPVARSTRPEAVRGRQSGRPELS